MVWEQFKYRTIPVKAVLAHGWQIIWNAWLWAEVSPRRLPGLLQPGCTVDVASQPQPALVGGELLSPASHRLGRSPSLFLNYVSRSSWPQDCYVWSETFIANSPFFCPSGSWTARAAGGSGQWYNLCQQVRLCASWNTNFFTCLFSLCMLYYCSNVNKLFVFPPSLPVAQCTGFCVIITFWRCRWSTRCWRLSGFCWATDLTLWLPAHDHCCSFCF